MNYDLLSLDRINFTLSAGHCRCTHLAPNHHRIGLLEILLKDVNNAI